MLLPALSAARERARTSNCLANTKQTTLAYLLYSDDYNGYLPWVANNTSGYCAWRHDAESNTTLPIMLHDYIQGDLETTIDPNNGAALPRVWVCGSNQPYYLWDTSPAWYSYNQMLNSNGLELADWVRMYVNYKIATTLASVTADPSQVSVIRDNDAAVNSERGAHGKDQYNLGMLDGHSESVTGLYDSTNKRYWMNWYSAQYFAPNIEAY